MGRSILKEQHKEELLHKILLGYHAYWQQQQIFLYHSGDDFITLEEDIDYNLRGLRKLVTQLKEIKN